MEAIKKERDRGEWMDHQKKPPTKLESNHVPFLNDSHSSKIKLAAGSAYSAYLTYPTYLTFCKLDNWKDGNRFVLV